MLRGALRRQVHVTFTDNARTMLSLRHREEAAFVRLHHMFSDAPAPILASIARYLQDGEQAAASRLSRYIDSRRERIRARPTRTPTLKTRGEQHDLCAIFAQLNRVYFADAIEARIGWGRMGRAPGRRRRRRSIKLGSYRERDALIRIHPALDQAWVPRFFVEYVVYHEMLHHALGIGVRAGRRRMHTPEFRRRERAFAWHAEATLWEREHLSRLLSS